MTLNFTKFYLFLALMITSVATNAQVTVSDSVVLGANYPNQAYYTLSSGAKTYAPLNEWDLAFKVNATQTAAIWVNEARRITVYHVPGANFTDVLDTANVANWTVLHNSESTWEIGALNANADSTDVFDYGWGGYVGPPSHAVSGSEVYVLAYSNLTFKKVTINTLYNGGNIYKFQYADLDNSNSVTDSIDKRDYTGKLFAYYDLAADSALDREPASWDLQFTTKQTPLVIPGFGTSYSAGTVYTNAGVETVKVTDADPANNDNYSGYTLSNNILTIGDTYRERISSPPPGFWQTVDSTLYFVEDKAGTFYKLIFTGFDGQSTGKIVFSKTTYQMNTGIEEVNGINNLSVYPNPVVNSATLSFNSVAGNTLEVFITDLSGKALFQATINAVAGANRTELSLEGLSTGVYMVYATDGRTIYNQKIVKY